MYLQASRARANLSFCTVCSMVRNTIAPRINNLILHKSSLVVKSSSKDGFAVVRKKQTSGSARWMSFESSFIVRYTKCGGVYTFESRKLYATRCLSTNIGFSANISRQ